MSTQALSPRGFLRLKLLNARLDRVVEFRQREEDESKLGTAAKVAGTAALAGGAGYAGLSLLRGRQWQKKVTGQVDNSLSGLAAATRTGHQMNVIAGRGALKGAKAQTSAFVQGAKEKIGTAAGQAGASLDAARRKVAAGAGAAKAWALRR